MYNNNNREGYWHCRWQELASMSRYCMYCIRRPQKSDLQRMGLDRMRWRLQMPNDNDDDDDKKAMSDKTVVGVCTKAFILPWPLAVS